jgi:isoamylase
LLFNARREDLEFELPEPPADAPSGWRRWVDTALASPADVCPPEEAPPIAGQPYRAAPHSVVALLAVLPTRPPQST